MIRLRTRWPRPLPRCYSTSQESREFILSVLQASPSARDARSYLNSFAPTPAKENRLELVNSLLNPARQHTALVKVQGPFSDRQLHAIVAGLQHLQKLGLISIIVLASESWVEMSSLSKSGEALKEMRTECMRVVRCVEEMQGGTARPINHGIFRIGSVEEGSNIRVGSLDSIRHSLKQGEIPVIAPIAVDSNQSCIPVQSDDCIRALASTLTRSASWIPPQPQLLQNMPNPEEPLFKSDDDADLLTPVRILIINTEGGIPSPARGGHPHLMINLASEYDFIHKTFIWQKTHPTSLSNLRLVRDCLQILPPTSSALIVSHRSPKALVSNLVNNKPAHSPSLHHSLLPHKGIQHTPTLIRKGLPIRVERSFASLDLDRLTNLLQKSFGRILDKEKYYSYLRQTHDFTILAGDYQAAAICTLLPLPNSRESILYLDKFAVLPNLQGSGIADFMWSALRDESTGLGLLDALNTHGGQEGHGIPRDLIWRSRRDNAVNKWYFDRSSGHVSLEEMGPGGVPGTLFWYEREWMEKDGATLVREIGTLDQWKQTVGGLETCWLPKTKAV